MKKIFFIGVVFLISSFSVFSQSKKKWEKTQSLNSITAYEDFLKKYPESVYAELAKQSLEQLEFLNAKQLNTIRGFNYFLSKHKYSKYSTEAQNLIDAIETNDDWGEAINSNTLEAYEFFIKQHPFADKVAEAMTYIENIDWQNAKSNNTVEGFNKFLKKHPGSSYSNEAQTNIENLDWQNAKAKNTLEAFNEFVKKYPSSSYSNEDNIENLEWIIVEKTEKTEELKVFLEKYPNGIHETQVKNRMEEILYQKCLTENRYLDYKQFITDYPNNKNISLIKSKIGNYKNVKIAKGTTISDNELAVKYYWNKESKVYVIDDKGIGIDYVNGRRWVSKNFALGNLLFLHAMITRTEDGIYFAEDTELVYRMNH
jgi:outer membrane protein assembly factor BamD (BamD/ComL family)